MMELLIINMYLIIENLLVLKDNTIKGATRLTDNKHKNL